MVWLAPSSVTGVWRADDFVDVMGPVSTRDTARPAASVKSVLIGQVPDRGGRTDESRGAASMPAWTTRRGAPCCGPTTTCIAHVCAAGLVSGSCDRWCV